MPLLLDASIAIIRDLVRERLPEGIRSVVGVDYLRTLQDDALEIHASWTVPDGRFYHAVERLQGRELVHEPDSTQHHVLVEVAARLVGGIERANRESLEGLAVRYGLTQFIPGPEQGFGYQQTNQGLGLQSLAGQSLQGQQLFQGVGQQDQLQAPKPIVVKPKPKPEPRSAWDRLLDERELC